jgi:hypothetical protein
MTSVNIDKAKAEEVYNKAALIALTMAGITLTARAKGNLKNKDTGELVNSIGYKTKVTGSEKSSVSLEYKEQPNNSVVTGTNLEYAPYIELGTGPHRTDYKKEEFKENMNKWLDRHGITDPSIRFLIIRAIRRRGTAAHPYLRPALDSTGSQVEAMFAKAFKQVTGGMK